jgi:PiT family inorganic phosphate transporter
VTRFFLLSGLFLGWSLGANDAANIFGTAVGSRMVRFKVAALVASVFVILGAVISGGGTTRTLTALANVNAMAGAFTVALAAAATIALMTGRNLPISTSQAIVGALIGWSLFTGTGTDIRVLSTIVWTWVFSPVFAAAIAAVLYLVSRRVLTRIRLHLLEFDAYTRLSLLAVGAFGAYALGANNIANVMGVFVPASPFRPITLGDYGSISSAAQLFFLGGCAIAVGIYTRSQRVMNTVGSELFRLTPVGALIVVLASSIVLFAFASQTLARVLMALHLPALPLVPVSGSQAIIGAIVGLAVAKGGHGLNYRILGRIALGWVTAPVIAATLCFVTLFFMQNVFEQPVVRP